MHNVSVYQLPLVLPTLVGTFYGLDCFGHMIYMLQTSNYQNIAKLLTHTCIEVVDLY